MRPYAIVFANAKGGVGKTTSVVHVAGAFAETGAETLVIDVDPQASATRYLGLDPSALEPTVTDVLIDPARGIGRAVHPTRYPNLACVPGHESLATMETELRDMPGRESLLEASWGDDLTHRLAVIDVPPSLSLYTVNALRAADAVVIPVQTHPFALESVPRTLDLVDRVQRRLNPDLIVLGYLATLYDRRTRVARECLQRMMDDWGEQLLETVVPTNIALAEAARDGRLIYDRDPNSTGSEAYLNVAAEILGRWRARRPAADTAEVGA